MPFCHFYQFDAAHSTLDFTNYAKHNVYAIELECNVVIIIIICTTQYRLVWTNVIRRRNRSSRSSHSSKKSTANKQHITQTRTKYFILIWKIFSKSFSQSADCWSTRNKTEFHEKYKNNNSSHNDWNEMKWNHVVLSRWCIHRTHPLFSASVEWSVWLGSLVCRCSADMWRHTKTEPERNIWFGTANVHLILLI